MNYLVYGLNNFLINQYLDKIIKKEKIDAMNINRYDLNNDSLSKVLEDALAMSLFADVKLVIADNCTYFNRVKNNEDDIAKVVHYLTHPNPNTYLVFISHSETIDNTKKITKLLKKDGVIVTFDDSNSESLVKDMFKDYQISSEVIKAFINRVGNNLDLLSLEALKLKEYKIDDKIITIDDVQKVTTLNIDTDIYKFVDNIINKNTEKALNTYYELLKNSDDATSIVALLASKFRLMYQSNILMRTGLNNNEIANTLSVHPYRVKLALEESTKYSPKVLLNFLLKLANLDNDIKTGKISAELGVELFILSV